MEAAASWEKFQEHASQEQVEADEAAALEALTDNGLLIAEFGATCGKAKTTRHKYERCVTEFAEFLGWWGVPSLIRAQRRDVVRFMAWLDGDERMMHHHLRGHVQERRALSASSRKGYLSATRAFYYYCLEMEYVEHDPTAGIRAPRVECTPGLTVGAEQLQQFLDAPGSERDRIQAYLFVFTAARAGELRSLRWRDVDWHNRELTFHGKGGKTNVIPMHDELVGALRRWLVAQRGQAETSPLIAAALHDEDTAFVLLTRAGRPVTVQTLGKQVKWRAARCDLLVHAPSDNRYRENKSSLHPHALRRSWATLQRRRGVALEDIADVLAHASTDTTRKHYAFPPSEAKRKTVKNFSLA